MFIKSEKNRTTDEDFAVAKNQTNTLNLGDLLDKFQNRGK